MKRTLHMNPQAASIGNIRHLAFIITYGALAFNEAFSPNYGDCADAVSCICLLDTSAPTNAPTPPTEAPTHAPTNAPTTPFIRIATGTCANSGNYQIDSKAQCEAAAMGLGLSDTVVGGWEAINRPAGCIYDGTVLKFNSQTSSLRNCGDDGYDCACMATTHAPTKAPTEAPTKAPTQAPTLAPTTKTPTQAPTSGDFIRIYDGTCTESGYDQITSALQCEAAANGLGLAATVTMDRTKQVHNGIRTMGQGIVEDRQYPTQWRPVGCYREGAVFRFNNYVPNKLWTAEQGYFYAVNISV